MLAIEEMSEQHLLEYKWIFRDKVEHVLIFVTLKFFIVLPHYDCVEIETIETIWEGGL